MEVSELMVRNYVSLHGKVIQITCIDETYNTINYFDGDAEGELTVSVKDIEPIPLTDEFFKKNGFEQKFPEYTPNWIWYVLNPNFFLEDRLKGCYYLNGCKIAIIKYVHELQNAMKICKINKNIEF